MPLQDANAAAQSSFGTQSAGGTVVSCPYADTHWIEIVLVDDEDQPLAGEHFVLVKPDGSRVEGTLDADGAARVEGIDPGTCEVTFPQVHERGWRRPGAAP